MRRHKRRAGCANDGEAFRLDDGVQSEAAPRKGASPGPADALPNYSWNPTRGIRGVRRRSRHRCARSPDSANLARCRYPLRWRCLHGPCVDTAGMVRTLIDRRMIVQVLAIVVGGLLKIRDAGVDLTHSFNLVAGLRP